MRLMPAMRRPSGGDEVQTCSCSQLPVIQIGKYEYGSVVKSADFHYAPTEKLKSTLPYPHRHDFYQIMWVRAGSGFHIIDSIRYEVSKNSLFFLSPGQMHTLELSEDTVGYTVSFSAEFFSFKMHNRQSLSEIPVYDFENLNSALYLDEQQADLLHPVMQAIIEEYANEEVGYEEVVWSYLRVFLLKSSRLIARAPAIDAASRSLLLSRRFKSLLEKNFRSTDDPEQYARQLKVTERALNEAIRHTLGYTAAQLIRERIMLEAKRLLLHSEISVAEVADRLGFDDPAYFSRCFKKHTSRSPLEFRQSLANLNI